MPKQYTTVKQIEKATDHMSEQMRWRRSETTVEVRRVYPGRTIRSNPFIYGQHHDMMLIAAAHEKIDGLRPDPDTVVCFYTLRYGAYNLDN